MPIRITSDEDPRLRDFTSLTDVRLRKLLEPEGGLYLAESEKVIRRALAAGHRPRALLMSPRWLEPLEDVVQRCEDEDVPVFVAEPDVVEGITGFNMHRGAMASMHRPAVPELEDLCGDARRVLVLEDLVDHTNVGAIFRSAAGLGFDAVLVTPRCADPLYRRAVRVSMGTVLQVPWTRLDAWPADVARLRDLGFVVAGLALAEDAVPLEDLAAAPPERLAVVVGTEGDGLTRHALAEADLTVTIPMHGGVDSLNAAAASAVAAWALRV